MEAAWINSSPANYRKCINNDGDLYFLHKLCEVSPSVKIGRYTYIHGNSRITADKPVFIGSFCSIASGVRIQVGDEHDYRRVSTFPFRTILGIETTYEEAFGKSVTIMNDVWIGEGARILSGTNISNGAVIGAGSVVKGDLVSYGIYVGNPARLVKRRFDDSIISLLEDICWWNWPLEKIMNNSSFFSTNLSSIDKEDLVVLKNGIK